MRLIFVGGIKGDEACVVMINFIPLFIPYLFATYIEKMMSALRI